MKVYWSDSLERLADGFFKAWQSKRSVFRKTCVVVHDMATRDWLKSHYLMNSGLRQVLINVEFIPLPEFINNWLFAKTHDEPLSERKANAHPYAQPVLSWRIYRILSDEQSLGKEMRPLIEYIGSDEKNKPWRRYALAKELAKLYDDYLNSRFAMLCNWEKGDVTPIEGVPEWQRSLYMRLFKDDDRSYAKDYDCALSADNHRKAIDNGFPDYISVHVFDIPDMPEPTLRLLEKLSDELDVTFWTFNPCGDWLADTLTKKSAVRDLCKQVRTALRKGQNPRPLELNACFENEDERPLGVLRLLSALGNGARAVLGAQVDADLVSPEDILGEPNAAFNRLVKTPVTVHSCYSPRRELEAIRDGLHDFFAKNADAKPRDALVLCGDWSSYAPIIDAVFETDPSAEGYIPITVAGGIPGDTPISRSFSDLLEFRENRFEVSAVFALLSVPAIRSHFGLEKEDVDTLWDMVKGANIHWGLDDDDVNKVVGMEKYKNNYPFTWRRGLDRMTLDMLYGPTEDGETLVEANNLGELLPVGLVEGDRAKCLKALDSFIAALSRIRRTMAQECKYTADEWRTRLLEAVGEFYDDNNENVGELKKIRAAIQSVADNAVNGGMTDAIDSDVFINAVQSNIKSILQGSSTPADSVVFAPLKSASATPHKLIWICGLNDGKFPRTEKRPSFDVIGTHPSIFDVTSRDKDGLALLKAVLSAKCSLVLSYVGRSIKSNDKIPSSVLLNDILEYFASNDNVQFYEHPLQGYSERYFIGNDILPKSYSSSDYAVANALRKRSAAQEGTTDNISAFDLNPDGETVIQAEELAWFLSRPNNYLIKKRLGMKIAWFETQIDDDVINVEIDKHRKSEIMLNEDDNEKKRLAKVMVEKGEAIDQEAADDEIYNINLTENIDVWRNYLLNFDAKTNKCYCQNMRIIDAYKAFLEKPTISNEKVECKYKNRDDVTFNIRIPFVFKRISLKNDSAPVDYVFFMEDDGKINDSQKAKAWVMHVIGHAAGFRFVTIFLTQKIETAKAFMPLKKEDAIKSLDEFLVKAFVPLSKEYPFFGIENNSDDVSKKVNTPLVKTKKFVSTSKSGEE